jgi:hypothetical protein
LQFDMRLFGDRFVAANGAVFTASGAVPEPVGWVLALLAATLLLRPKMRGAVV